MMEPSQGQVFHWEDSVRPLGAKVCSHGATLIGRASATDTFTSARSVDQSEATLHGTDIGHEALLLSEDLEPEDLLDVDFRTTSAEVYDKLLHFLLEFIQALSRGHLPFILVPSRRAQHAVAMQHSQAPEQAHAEGTAVEAAHEQLGGSRVEEGRVLRLRRAEKPLDLVADSGASTFTLARVFLVLKVVAELLRKGQKATMRDVYYWVKGEVVRSVRDVEEAVFNIMALFRVPRRTLGIVSSSKGLIAGHMWLQEPGGARRWQDCLQSGHGVPISGDPAVLMASEIAAQPLECILVVEKEAVYQSLLEGGLLDALRCVVATGRGMPDLCTRLLLRRLHEAMPGTPVLGLVDWNPAGITILNVFRCGSWSASMEGHRYAVPSIRWLGMRHHMLSCLASEQLQPLTLRDQMRLTKLASCELGAEPAWQQETLRMQAAGCKAEIEALCMDRNGVANVSHLCHLVVEAVSRKQYV